MMRVAILLNGTAGGARRIAIDRIAARIRAACADHEIEARIEICAGAGLAGCARAALAEQPPPDAIVAAGGDGTISTIAGAIIESGVPLGILPLGTFNHLARDLGLSLTLDEAVANLRHGECRRIDVGEVNGRIFLNNSSVGLYSALVAGRERLRARGIHPKWLAHGLAALRLIGRYRNLHLTLLLGETALHLTAALVFIGNNPYRVDRQGLGRRRRLDGGKLAIYLVRNTGWLGVGLLGLRLLLGLVDPMRELELHEALAVDLATRRHRRLTVALDGEVSKLHPPLRYRCRPQALDIIVPVSA